MEVGSFLPLGEAVNCWLLAFGCWRVALSEADDLAVGRGDDDLALGFVVGSPSTRQTENALDMAAGNGGPRVYADLPESSEVPEIQAPSMSSAS